MHRLIVYAIPIFMLLIAVEFAYGLAVRRNTYRLNDALSSLSQGVLSQAVAVCTQFFQIGLYTWIFPKVAVFADAALWNHAGGWLLALVLYDLCDYWLHRVSHTSAIFWAAHVVHHQSQCFNFSTALRQESAYAFLGWMFYLPLAAVGVPPELFAAAGLAVLVYQFWIHTEHIGRLGWFDRVFSSPSNHRVHHAVNDGYIDKNFGAVLVLWDRLFGTFEPEGERCIYGTRVPLNSWDPLRAVADVYRSLAFQVWHTPAWSDKLRVLLKRPGWVPPSLLAPARAAAPAETAAVFDPPLNPTRGWIASLVFLAVTASACRLLWNADELSPLVLWTDAGAIAAGLWAVGALTSGRIGGLAGGMVGGLTTGLVWLASAGAPL